MEVVRAQQVPVQERQREHGVDHGERHEEDRGHEPGARPGRHQAGAQQHGAGTVAHDVEHRTGPRLLVQPAGQPAVRDVADPVDGVGEPEHREVGPGDGGGAQPHGDDGAHQRDEVRPGPQGFGDAVRGGRAVRRQREGDHPTTLLRPDAATTAEGPLPAATPVPTGPGATGTRVPSAAGGP